MDVRESVAGGHRVIQVHRSRVCAEPEGVAGPGIVSRTAQTPVAGANGEHGMHVEFSPHAEIVVVGLGKGVIRRDQEPVGDEGAAHAEAQELRQRVASGSEGNLRPEVLQRGADGRTHQHRARAQVHRDPRSRHVRERLPDELAVHAQHEPLHDGPCVAERQGHVVHAEIAGRVVEFVRAAHGGHVEIGDAHGPHTLVRSQRPGIAGPFVLEVAEPGGVHQGHL